MYHIIKSNQKRSCIVTNLTAVNILVVVVFVVLLYFALAEVFNYFKKDGDNYSLIINTTKDLEVKDTDKSCTFHTCFDVYSCGTSDNKLIKIYVYNDYKYFTKNGEEIKLFTSKQFKQLIHALQTSRYYTSNASEACIFIPQIDLLNQENVDLQLVATILEHLPYWNKGTNHLLFNMLPGSPPNYFTSLEVRRGKALIAGGGFSMWSYRKTYDVSIPVFNFINPRPMVNDGPLGDNSGRRSWLLVSSQVNIHRDYVKVLREIQHSDGDKFLMLNICPDKDIHKRCDLDGVEYKYPDILRHSDFCLVLRSNRLGQMQLLDCLMHASIPLIVIDSYVLPFSEVLEWKRASIRLDEVDLPIIMDHLKSINSRKVLEMRRQVQFFYRRYFKSMQSIALTTIDILNDRVYPHWACSHEQWNDELPAQNNLFTLPLTIPKTSGFTALILTFDRLESLFDVIELVAKVDSLVKIVVVWNNQVKRPPPASAWPKINKPLKIVQTRRNVLSNRFYPYPDIETEAVLSLDDDISMLTVDEIQFAYEVWCEYPDQIVGFASRRHTWDAKSKIWRYDSEWASSMSMVLTGAAFYHKYYHHTYTYKLPPGMREWADKQVNCEDIAFNFMVAVITRKPVIKVTPRQKFRCPECQNITSNLSGILEFHMLERSECINKFTEMFNMTEPPLILVEYRGDPVLYNYDKIPSEFLKFRDIGTL